MPRTCCVNKYGMHPLTVTWARAHLYRVGLEELPRRGSTRLRQLVVHAERARPPASNAGLRSRICSILFQPFIFGQKSLAPKMALLHKILLVLYGENEAEYGNPDRRHRDARRDWAYFHGEGPARRSISAVFRCPT